MDFTFADALGGIKQLTEAALKQEDANKASSVSSPSFLFPENRSLPHKKRRLLYGDDEENIESGDAGSKCLLKEESIRSRVVERDEGDSIVSGSTPFPLAKPPKAATKVTPAKKKTPEAAWMHRLYPFDGPSIEDFTLVFMNVNVDQLVRNKLEKMKDMWLAKVIKSYYEEIIKLDHNEFKKANRPPHGTPDDIRPFLLSQNQLKSFNSDFLRSALRKLKINKFFCVLLRGPLVKGVPEELRSLGNEAFARSIRTHQIIAFFTRYFCVYQTKCPEKVLDLSDAEHKLLRECLHDIVRRVSAKQVIQQSVLSGDCHFVKSDLQRKMSESQAINQSQSTIEDDTFTQGEISNEDALETDSSTSPVSETDENENKRGYDSSRIVDTIDASISNNSPVSLLSNLSTTPRIHASILAYNNVLAMLSDDARHAVENMIENIKRKVVDETRSKICNQSFDEGRRIGRIEGRIEGRIIGHEEAISRRQGIA